MGPLRETHLGSKPGRPRTPLDTPDPRLGGHRWGRDPGGPPLQSINGSATLYVQIGCQRRLPILSRCVWGLTLSQHLCDAPDHGGLAEKDPWGSGLGLSLKSPPPDDDSSASLTNVGMCCLQMKMRCETRTVPAAGMWREKNLDEAGADQNPRVLSFFPTTTSTAEMISCAASERSMVGGFVARGAMLEWPVRNRCVCEQVVHEWYGPSKLRPSIVQSTRPPPKSANSALYHVHPGAATATAADHSFESRDAVLPLQTRDRRTRRKFGNLGGLLYEYQKPAMDGFSLHGESDERCTIKHPPPPPVRVLLGSSMPTPTTPVSLAAQPASPRKISNEYGRYRRRANPVVRPTRGILSKDLLVDWVVLKSPTVTGHNMAQDRAGLYPSVDVGLQRYVCPLPSFRTSRLLL
ncbi:hypothetical protein B0T13DRAFT_447451 [Neurospora crassa]|nr:hypothetical protein B0T13DRAFT_447451 [Neurospora crassa]